MLMRFKHAVVVVMLLALSVGAFAGGGAVYRMVRRSRSVARAWRSLRLGAGSPGARPSPRRAKLSKQTDLRPVDLFLKVEGRLRAHYYERLKMIPAWLSAPPTGCSIR